MRWQRGGQGRRWTLGPGLVGLILLAAAGIAEAEPVILLHGLWGTSQSWRAYADHLRAAGWREGCLIEFPAGSVTPEWVPRARRDGSGPTLSGAWASDACDTAPEGDRVIFRVVFRDNDGQSYQTQGQQVAAAVARVRAMTGATKVTLVAHSMGGLAARAYLQSSGYQGDVSTLVTAATPHMGSLLPYLGKEDASKTCRSLARWFTGKDFSRPAIAALAPDSPEMLALGSATAPFGPLPVDVRYANLVANFESDGESGCIAGYRRYLANWQRALVAHFDADKARSLATGDVLVNWTDGIVPAWSQIVKTIPVGYGLKVDVGIVESFHSDVTDNSQAWKFVDRYLPAVTTHPSGARAAADAIDLIFCIDTTGSMGDDIDAVKASAATIIEQTLAVSSSARLALVAYRDHGSSYVTKGFPFTTDKTAIRRAIDDLSAGEGGDTPEAVYEALLHAINTTDLGPWRDGVRKVIVLMGDAPPHTRQHTLDEVAKAAEGVDPAHVFPISIAGASAVTVSAFSDIARATGGAMGSTRSAADLPRELLKMVRLSASMADAESVEGRVTARMGEAIEIQLDHAARVLPGMTVLVFSAATPGLLIAEGRLTTGESQRWTVELSAQYGTEMIAAGCSLRVLLSK